MLKVLSHILCDLNTKVKVIGKKAGFRDGVPSTPALVNNYDIASGSKRTPCTNSGLQTFENM